MRLLAIALALGACRNGEPPPAPALTPRDAHPAIAHDAADDLNDFAALDEMFGGDGLIRGFDPARVIGESPASLKQAVPGSFAIGVVCDEYVCSAEAPLPGGRKVRIGVMRMSGGHVGVSFVLSEPQLLHLYSRLETALGLSEILDKEHRVYTHDSLRYLVHAVPPTWAVTVKIEKIVTQ